MNISIVIPNFNGEELLIKNLPSVIEAKKNKKNNILEIIVVDDASQDSSAKILKEEFKGEVRVFSHTKNKGFAATVNTGVRMAKGNFVCLLNSDVIPSKNFLETMVEDFEDKQVFGVSLHEKGFGYAKGKFLDGFIVHEGMPETGTVTETFWASGGSSVLRRETFMELKGLDEVLLPFYWEDLDLSYRAQKRGYKVLWDPRANVVHHHESTYGKLNQKYVQRMRERNHLLFIWKNLTSSRFMAKHIASLFRRILAHPGYLRIVFMALAKYGKLMERRRKEIKETIVSDEAIFAKF